MRIFLHIRLRWMKQSFYLGHCYQLEVILHPPRGHLALSGGIFSCHNQGMGDTPGI